MKFLRGPSAFANPIWQISFFLLFFNKFQPTQSCPFQTGKLGRYLFFYNPHKPIFLAQFFPTKFSTDSPKNQDEGEITFEKRKTQNFRERYNIK